MATILEKESFPIKGFRSSLKWDGRSGVGYNQGVGASGVSVLTHVLDGFIMN